MTVYRTGRTVKMAAFSAAATPVRGASRSAGATADFAHVDG
jgi:hypothetical protein